MKSSSQNTLIPPLNRRISLNAVSRVQGLWLRGGAGVAAHGEFIVAGSIPVTSGQDPEVGSLQKGEEVPQEAGLLLINLLPWNTDRGAVSDEK